MEPKLDSILGIVSRLPWALVLVVSVEYGRTLVRVYHESGGGVLAPLALPSPPKAFGEPSGLSLSRAIFESALVYATIWKYRRSGV